MAIRTGDEDDMTNPISLSTREGGRPGRFIGHRARAAATIAVGALAGALACAAPAAAQLKLDIRPGAAFQPMPIAVPACTGDGSLGPQVEIGRAHV